MDFAKNAKSAFMLFWIFVVCTEVGDFVSRKATEYKLSSYRDAEVSLRREKDGKKKN